VDVLAEAKELSKCNCELRLIRKTAVECHLCERMVGVQKQFRRLLEASGELTASTAREATGHANPDTRP